jgi:hypothetical protein
MESLIEMFTESPRIALDPKGLVAKSVIRGTPFS